MNARPALTALLALALVATLAGAKRLGDAPSPFTNKKGQIKVMAPAGWVVDSSGATTSFTRDGFNLHAVVFSRVDLKDAFKALREDEKGKAKKRRTIAADTPPEDLAEDYIASFRRNSETAEELANEPATVAGFPAFKVTMEAKDERGLRVRSSCYGYIAETGYFQACYRAPSLHYYERDLAEFERMVASLEHLSKKKK